MKIDLEKENKKSWLNRKYHNMATACSAQKYDILFNISLEILEKYPYDNYALYSYATCLCINGELEEAKQIFEFLLQKMDISKCKFVLTCLMRIEFNLANFENAYDYLIQIKDLFPTENVRLYESFLDYQLMGIITNDTPKTWYDYKPQLRIQHIIMDHVTEIENRTAFSSSTNIEQLFNAITNELENVPRKISFNPYLPLKDKFFPDVYYLKADSIFYSNEQPCPYVKIIVVPFTNNVINFYPVNHIDVAISKPNIFELSRKTEKVKKLEPVNQIDKFCKKWGR